METKTNVLNKSVCVEIIFNDTMDEGEVIDFLERSLSKYKHPDDVVKTYSYWFEST